MGLLKVLKVCGTFSVFSFILHISFIFVSGEASNNPILEIESGAFKGLSKLHSLCVFFFSLSPHSSFLPRFIDHNSLTKVESGIFEGLDQLYFLFSISIQIIFHFIPFSRLSSNPIVYLEENIFGANTNLPQILFVFSLSQSLSNLFFSFGN